MALDPSIILGIRPVEIPDQVKGYANVLALKAQQQQMQRNALLAQREDDAYQRDTESRNALRNYYANGRTPEGLQALAAVSPEAYAAEQKAQLEEQGKRATIGKDNATAEKDNVETKIKQLSTFAQAARNVKDQPGYDQLYQMASTMYGPEAMASIPRQYNPQFVQMALNATLTEAQRIQNQLGQDNLKVSQQNARTASDRLTFEQGLPRGQIVQTPDGPLLINTRNGTGQAVTGPDGKPVAAPLQKPPSSIVTAHADNNSVLGNIDDALAGLSSPEGKNATGIGKGIGYRVPLVGEQLVNAKDPGGMATRALIANIGSKIIHDRSGAAVTISEMPRLAPFIPAIGDKPEQVAQKLKLLRENIAAIQGEFEDTYSGLKPYGKNRPPDSIALDPVRQRANSYYGNGQ